MEIGFLTLDKHRSADQIKNGLAGLIPLPSLWTEVGAIGSDSMASSNKETILAEKLMDVYAQRQGGTTNAYRFIFDGNRIVETQTPFNLQMENDDVIDAMLEQRGD